MVRYLTTNDRLVWESHFEIVFLEELSGSEFCLKFFALLPTGDVAPVCTKPLLQSIVGRTGPFPITTCKAWKANHLMMYGQMRHAQ